jgi:hypothetical protein
MLLAHADGDRVMRFLLRCISPLVARSEHAALGWLRLLLKEDRTQVGRSFKASHDPSLTLI